ncbi:MAG: hypothetical protein AB7N71_05725 [Phycisphaerae bacterium]
MRADAFARRRGSLSVAVAAFATCLLSSQHVTRAEDLHFTYLWHMEQPIYWPVPQASGADRYERAWESIVQTDMGRANPLNDLRVIFGNADRVPAYQYRTRDSLNRMRNVPGAVDVGVQVSYSGGLIENIFSLGNANQLGYSPTWYGPYREARNWQTSGGQPRMDIVQFSFHHALLPLCDENTVRMQIRLYKEIYADAWSANPGPSRGFFPSEMAFSERLIPILASEGIDWCIVSNEKISRACADFPLVLGSGGVNCEPPNRADVLNPPQSDYYRLNISRGCAPANAVPYAYTPHYARYVDPNTGTESRIIVVPAAQAIGWEDGSRALGLSEMNTLNANNDPARPMLVLMAHDGDNFYAGGFSYYTEAAPNFVAAATAAGYSASTVEQYLQDHPVPIDEVVHVEDGAWINADGDFGSPTFLNWNWPLLNASGQVDIPNGWHVDERNWAVITAAQNRVDTATQISCGVGNDCLRPRKIVYPDATTTNAERAWHYFNGALNSGFMYYGNTLDHEVKPTIACNLAMQYADVVIGSAAEDETPPTVWIPQRFPYNPGSTNFGPSHAYQQVVSDGDFWIWTFAYDVSGIQSVELKYRLDDDDELTDANRVYAGTWQTLPMTQRAFPTGNVFNDPSINFFELPQYIADQYSVELTGVREKLVDYYVEATDTRGFVKRSPIQHVWVGDGTGGGGPTNRVTFDPIPGQAGAPLTITYDPAGGPLGGANAVFAHMGYDNWATILPDFPLVYDATSETWSATVNLPDDIFLVNIVFNNGQGTWDNNNGQDWALPVVGAQPLWVMDGQLEASAERIASNGAFELYAEHRNGQLYVAARDAGEGNDHFIFVAQSPGSMGAAPWAKAGLVAQWSAYLADENDNSFAGWFNLAPGSVGQAGTGSNGGWLEGVLDLEDEFGTIPDSVWLAFAPYQTQNGGLLVSSQQVPPPVIIDANLQAAEYVEFSLADNLVGDMNCDGAITVSDIGGFVLALTDPTSYDMQFPDCDRANADTNNDGAVTVSDIGPFVSLLVK